MSFRATLTIGNQDFEVLKCISETVQQIDIRGRGLSAVKGGDLRIVLRGIAEETLPSWAMSSSKKYDGTITYYKMDGIAVYRKIAFEDAYLTWFAESYMPAGDNENFEEVIPFLDEFEKDMYKMARTAHQEFGTDYLLICKISAKKITTDDVEHDNHW